MIDQTKTFLLGEMASAPDLNHFILAHRAMLRLNFLLSQAARSGLGPIPTPAAQPQPSDNEWERQGERIYNPKNQFNPAPEYDDQFPWEQ